MKKDNPEINLRFAEKLFLHVLEDLSQRRTQSYLYERINCGRLLRQLIIDGDVLANVANRRVRAPLFFTVIRYGEPNCKIVIPAECQLYLIKNPGPGAYLDLLKLDKYLKYEIASYGDASVSVSDIIKYVANNYGGVHLDPGADAKVKMHLIDQTIHANGEGAIFSLLSNVIDTTIAALCPIRDALRKAFYENDDAIRFGDESKAIDPVKVPESTNEKIGTISFWLRSKVDPEWYRSNKPTTFPPIKFKPFEICIHKDQSNILHVQVLGLLGENYSLRAKVPDPKTVAPQHGVQILINWNYPELCFFLHGQEIERQKMKPLLLNGDGAKEP